MNDRSVRNSPGQVFEGWLVLALSICGSANAETVAHWKFANATAGAVASGNGTVLDSSPNGLHGTAFGGPIYDDSCSCDLGLRFDGVDDRVFVADDPMLALTESFTTEAVIRLDSLPTGAGGRILFRGDQLAGQDPYTLVVLFDGRLESSIDNGSAIDLVISPNPIPFGTILHVAATLDHATGRHELFINGTSVGHSLTSVRPYATLVGPNPGLGIGNTQHSDHQNFPGLILEARISDVALSPSEFLSSCPPGQLKNFGAGCPGSFGLTPILAMQGCPISSGSLTMSISNAAPQSTALLLFGLFETAIPAAGTCTLHVAPILPSVFPLPLGGSLGVPGSGSIALPFVVPSSSLGGTVKLQAFVRDTANAWGYATTNGFSVTIVPW